MSEGQQVIEQLVVDFVQKEHVYLMDGLTLDNNLVILDERIAGKMGLPRTAVQGQFQVAQFVRMLTRVGRPEELTYLDLQFLSPWLFGDSLTCVAYRNDEDADAGPNDSEPKSGPIVNISLVGKNPNGEVISRGNAVIRNHQSQSINTGES